MINTPSPCKADTIQEVQQARDAYVDELRTNGLVDPGKKTALENRIKAFVEASRKEERAQALFELATLQRLSGEIEAAVKNYERAAAVAKENGDAGTEFRAWIGVARIHSYFTRDHGAAAAAFERAVASAGSAPTQQQRYEMLDYSSQLQAGRGELEAALLNALQATELAQTEADRFYAFLDTGDVLHKFAESCDYRRLVDARSSEEDDPWGACKRVVLAAKSYYEKAGGIAGRLGWTFTKKQVQDTIMSIDFRLQMMERQAAYSEMMAQSAVFNAQKVSDIVVNESFASGGWGLKEEALVELIEQTAPAEAKDPRGLFLRGIQADMQSKPEQALEYYQKAVKLLSTERASYFDIRQRGTIVENRPELIRDLGLRLLALGKHDEAFAVFESMRARGLESLTTAFQQNRFTDAERKAIADVVQLDSLVSAKQNNLVETVIAGVAHSSSSQLLAELDLLQKRLRELKGRQLFQSVQKRLETADAGLPTLGELREAVNRVNVPVLLYWVTPTNVLVWAVSPKGVEVKSVFLPEQVVGEKATRVRESLSSPTAAFDEKSARELHTYLVKPFARHLGYRQAVVIAQGALMGLPFEALVDAEDARFVADKLAISYAPNAASAIRSLGRKSESPTSIRALFDQEIENTTREVARIKGLKGVAVDAVPATGKSREQIIALLGKVPFIHVLLHGEHNYDEALQSTVKLEQGRLTAAELLASDWRDTYLAVFSSCESAVVKTRISNEGFGLSWALLAGGAKNVVLSRWRVNAASNADWMETFYRTMVAEKASPALAANAAMRKMIQGNRPPYFWAGPQVFGR